MSNYNPNAWFQWRELVPCAVQVLIILTAFFGIVGALLYLLLVR